MSRSRRLARERRQELLVRQAQMARKRRRHLAAGGIGTVLTVILVLVLIRLVVPHATAAGADRPAADRISSTVNSALTVPASILDAVGRGEVGSLPVRLATQPPLVANGKPLVLYVGAEYCPFCAAQRWALVVALSRFGTFQDLKSAWSGTDDVFPDTATVSFYGATYTSEYLAFEGVELATSERRGGQYAPLQSLTASQQDVMRTYNAPPYVSRESAGSVPFVDFGNQFLMSGAAFSPSLLKGLTQEQVAAALSDPASPVARAVLGSANAMTGALCQLTGGEPAGVCAAKAAAAFPETRSVGV